jgi:hypothetical protein
VGPQVAHRATQVRPVARSDGGSRWSAERDTWLGDASATLGARPTGDDPGSQLSALDQLLVRTASGVPAELTRAVRDYLTLVGLAVV